MIGARLEHDAAAGQVDADGLEQGSQPDRRAQAAHQPGHRADHADGQRLAHHRVEDLAARGAEGAQQAELADALGDGDRERVEDQERGHHGDHAAEHQQDDPQVAQEVLVDLVGLARGVLAARSRPARCAAAPPAGACCSCSALTPSAPATNSWSNLPTRPATRWAAGRVSVAEATAPERGAADLVDAHHPVALHAPVAGHADALAELEAVAVGRAAVDGGLARRFGARARRCRSAGRTASGRSRRRSWARSRLPRSSFFSSTRRTTAKMPPAAASTPSVSRTRSSSLAENGGGSSLVLAHDLARGDHHVAALQRALEQLVEGRVDGVGEHQRARHQRHAQEHGEHHARQPRPALGQSPQDQLAHRASPRPSSARAPGSRRPRRRRGPPCRR